MEPLPLVLSLDSSGTPLRWITFEECAYYYAKNLVAWSMGEVDFTLHGGTSRMTGLQSKMIMNTIIAIRGKISTNQIEKVSSIPLTNRTLFQRDHQLCAYCGNHFKIDRLTRDHILPTSKGGLNNWMNCTSSCSPCNRHKGARTPEEAKMPILYLPYKPNRSEVLILSNRRILADQQQFLISKVPKESRLLQ